MTQEFEFTEEMKELREMVREFCTEFSPEPVVRETMESETGFDPELWRRLGSELGIFGLAVDEESGGEGLGLVHHAVVIEELGAALVSAPVFATLGLAIPALNSVPDSSVRSGYLPAIISGDSIATVVIPSRAGEFDPEGVSVEATGDGAERTLSGALYYVPFGSSADLILVAARTDSGVAFFAIDGSAPGMTREALTSLDSTRRQATIILDNTPARMIATETEAPEVFEKTLLTATALLAVSQVGGSQRMLDITIAHVSTRFQFGQAVGAFQAVKHRCANMLVAEEQARSAAYHGVWALQDGTDDPRAAVSLAKAVASESFLWVSRSAIQMHGGMGFTWDGTPQLYFKRATADSLTLGTAEEHFEHLARFALDGLVPMAA